MSAGPALPAPAAVLLPHQPPMLLVDRLLSVAPDGLAGTASATLGPACPLATADGSLEPVAAIELVAQAYAAVRGCAQQAAGRPPAMGMLVGVSTARFPGWAALRAEPPVNLDVSVSTTGRFGGFALVEGTVSRGAQPLATVRLKVWAPDDADPADPGGA